MTSPRMAGGPLAAIGMVCAAMALFVASDSISKALAQSLPALQISWGRAASLTILVALVMGPRMGTRLVRTRKLRLNLMRGLAFATGSTVAIVALRTLPLADATAIINLQPLMILALSAPMLGERVGWRQWLAVAAGFCGVMLILRPGGDGDMVGASLMLVASFSGAVYYMLTRKLGIEEHPVTSLFFNILVATCLLTLAMPFVWIMPTSGWQWFGMFAAGASSGFAHYLLIRACTILSPATLAPFNYSHLLWGIGTSWLVFGEVPTSWTLGGIAFIGGAGLYVIYLQARARRA